MYLKYIDREAWSLYCEDVYDTLTNPVIIILNSHIATVFETEEQ